MIKYKLGATIPCAKYGNLLPEVELEGDNIDELRAIASAHIEDLWRTYGEVGLNKNNSSGKEIKTFTGETIIYSDESHSYYSLDGVKLVSGSEFAGNNSAGFNKDAVLPATAKKHGVSEGELDDLWSRLGDVSNQYGSSVHSALDLYHKYHAIGRRIADNNKDEGNYALSKLPHLRDIVVSFVDTFGADAITEVFVSDVKNKMAGQIDRLEILDAEKKICNVADFKTNHTLNASKIKEYTLQLGFYAKILRNNGWTVDNMHIYHFNSTEWTKVPLDTACIEQITVV